VPLALFGPDRYAILMGRLAVPILLAQAASPSIGAWLLARFGANMTIGVLCGAAIANFGLALPLVAVARKRATRPGFRPGA